MVEQDEWVFFKEIDFECPNFNRFNIDTRDFHCGYIFEDSSHKDINTLKGKNFFHTLEELKETLERFYEESGGKDDWRFFSLESYGKSWELKYLRIFREEDGYIICDLDNKALNKDILQGKIDKELL